MKIQKFFTPSCGQCKVVSQMLSRLNIEVEEIDCTKDENQDLVDKYHISHVPVVVITNDDGSIKKLNNIPEVKEWLAHQ